MSDVGGKQMGAFMVKKGDYLSELATTHEKSYEYAKAKELLMQAAGWYKKAGATDKLNEALRRAKEQDEKARAHAARSSG